MNKNDQSVLVCHADNQHKDDSIRPAHKTIAATRKRKSLVLTHTIEDALISRALQRGVELMHLKPADCHDIPELVGIDFDEAVSLVIERLENKIAAGQAQLVGTTILHTAPHHDDIVLGYHTYAMRNLENNTHHVVYMTNGSHGVADDFVADLLQHCIDNQQDFADLNFDDNVYQQGIDAFVDAYRQHNQAGMQQARHLIFMAIVADVEQISNGLLLHKKLEQLLHYVSTDDHKDHGLLQDSVISIKGRIRQSESDCKWAITGGGNVQVHHFAADFYDNDSQAAFDGDVQRFVRYLCDVQPDIVTVALDPCGVGPSAHFVSLQVVMKALQIYGDTDIQIIGYRNVWSAFSLAIASIVVPVSQSELDSMESIFLNCFATQQDPLFPSLLCDGPFSIVARQQQEQQSDDVRMLLGRQGYKAAIFLKYVDEVEVEVK